MDDIVKKISEIYFRYGIKSITMDDLASELGMSKKTLYQYFKDKQDVVSKVIDYVIESQRCSFSEFSGQEEKNAIDQLFDMSRIITAHMQQINPVMTYDLQKHYPKAWRKLLDFKQQTIFEYAMNNIKTGIMQGLFRDDLNYDIIMTLYVSRLELYIEGTPEILNRYAYAEIFNTMFVYHVRAISNAKGSKYLDTLMASLNE